MSFSDSPDDILVPKRYRSSLEVPRRPRQEITRLHSYSLDLGSDYASDASLRLHKPSARDQTAWSWREDFVLELGLEGVPVIAAVLAVVGVFWTVSAINSSGQRAYIFPAIYMALGFGMLYLVSNNVRKRFRRSRRKPRIVVRWRKSAQ